MFKQLGRCGGENEQKQTHSRLVGVHVQPETDTTACTFKFIDVTQILTV